MSRQTFIGSFSARGKTNDRNVVVRCPAALAEMLGVADVQLSTQTSSTDNIVQMEGMSVRLGITWPVEQNSLSEFAHHISGN